jgi:hypothetical protein
MWAAVGKPNYNNDILISFYGFTAFVLQRVLHVQLLRQYVTQIYFSHISSKDIANSSFAVLITVLM